MKTALNVMDRILQAALRLGRQISPIGLPIASVIRNDKFRSSLTWSETLPGMTPRAVERRLRQQLRSRLGGPRRSSHVL